MARKWCRIAIALATVGVIGAIVGCYLYAYYLTRDDRPRTLYCWLVFGSEGKPRILVRCDDGAISVDTNGNGRFEPNERFARIQDCKGLEILSVDGQTTYTIASVHYQRINVPPWARLRIYVDIRGPREYRQLGEADMAAARRDAVEIPFDGPLTIEVPYDYFRTSEAPHRPIQFWRGGKPRELETHVATLRPRSGAAVCPNIGYEPAFPEGIRPVVDIEFPPKEGAAPIRKRYVLDGFC